MCHNWSDTFSGMTKKNPKKQINATPVERLAIALTESIGSPFSVVLHTFLFIGIFALHLFGVSYQSILLLLTTAVSLEAIYLAVFLQMTVNRNTRSLEEVEEDIDEIQEDVEGMEKDIDEIEKDIDEIQEGVEEIQEDDEEEEATERHTRDALAKIESGLQHLMADIERLKKQKK